MLCALGVTAWAGAGAAGGGFFGKRPVFAIIGGVAGAIAGYLIVPICRECDSEPKPNPSNKDSAPNPNAPARFKFGS
jgi:hypothetical protein